MTDTSRDNWRYQRVPRGEVHGALDLLAGAIGTRRGDARRMWRELPSESTEHLYAAYDPAGRMVSAAWLMPRAGRSALLFLAPVQYRRHVEPVGRLVDRVCGVAGQLGLTVAQALVDPQRDTDRDALAAGGFDRLAHLDYLQRLKPPRPKPVDWPAGVAIYPYHDSRRDRFAAALAASYEQTLDCPGLCGMRRTLDILAGHMAVGRFEPQLWTLLEINDEPAGVLLLNPVPEAKCIELVYLGLAVPARGRGLGRLLMDHCLHQCAGQRQPTIAVAVDRANTPAARLYRERGFYRVASKVAMVRQFAATDPAQPTGYPQIIQPEPTDGG